MMKARLNPPSDSEASPSSSTNRPAVKLASPAARSHSTTICQSGTLGSMSCWPGVATPVNIQPMPQTVRLAQQQASALEAHSHAHHPLDHAGEDAHGLEQGLVGGAVGVDVGEQLDAEEER